MTAPVPDLSSQVALVTGGGRGIGRAIALALAGAGADVVVAGRDTARLEDVAAEIRKLGTDALPVRADVTSADSVDALTRSVIDRFGRIDVIVNNSGILLTAPLLDTDVDAFDRVLDTNLRGTYLVTRSAGRYLVEQRSGCVINVASNFALQGVANHSAYSASKAAVIAFTRSMAVEWARAGVRVNAIAPGYVATDLNEKARSDPELAWRIASSIPLHRFGEAAEIGPWAVLLATAQFVTGEVIVIDGGQSVR